MIKIEPFSAGGGSLQIITIDYMQRGDKQNYNVIFEQPLMWSVYVCAVNVNKERRAESWAQWRVKVLDGFRKEVREEDDIEATFVVT